MKKRKLTSFSDPDTTTPLDAMCQSSFNSTVDHFSKEEASIHSSDELSGEEEEEEDEKEDCNVSEESLDASLFFHEYHYSLKSIGSLIYLFFLRLFIS